MKDEHVIIGGKRMAEVYGDFVKEMVMFNEAWWKQRIVGDFHGRPQPFPIETLNVTEDFDWDNELLFKAIALRGSPYLANFITTGRDPSEVRSMCCRYGIDLTELARKNGGYFGAGDLTGSIGVCTMNMPLHAYLTKNEDVFFDILDNSMSIAKDSLELKRKFLESHMVLYPYSKASFTPAYEKFGEYWKNHFSTIGLVGMHEACLNLLDEGIETKSGQDFSLRVLDYMRNRLLDFQEETGNMYNFEATPAEGASHDLPREKDLINHSDIIHSGTKEAPYYTNSTHLPLGLKWPLGQCLTHQEPLQEKYTGGTVHHIWGNESVPWWEGISKLLNRILRHTKLPYLTYTPTTSICPIHGFMSGEYWTCPTCGEDCEVWSRVTGYFSPIHQWHDGKRQEFRERHHFVI